jgi:hypothetical protein
MLVFLHGSGDDDLKPENWMPLVAAIMEFHGELAVVLPGVGSDDRSNLKKKGKEFVSRLKSRWERFGSPAAGRLECRDSGSLHTALAGDNLDTLRSFRGALNFQKANKLIDAMEQSSEKLFFGLGSSLSGNGIKIRAAIAAFCAILYAGYLPADKKRPLRIIGHSRGGSAAISCHNLCNYWGLVPKTLTLDPCHGVVSLRENKPHWHTVWGGSVYNMPAVKQVGDMPQDTTKRPPITAHADGNAVVTNRAKLEAIKHGHMGKFRNFSDAEKKAGRKTMKDAQNLWLFRCASEAQQGIKTPAQHLQEAFTKWGSNGSADHEAIWAQVIANLTG